MAVALLQPLSHEPFLVGHGIDTFKINVKLLAPDGTIADEQPIPPRLEALLSLWQEQAKENACPVSTSMTFHDERMTVLPNGAPAWKYIIKNDCIQLTIAPRLHIPMVAKVTFSSAYLWELGNPFDALEEVEAFLYDLFGSCLALQPAQIDLCADIVGLHLPTEWEQVFVTHAIGKRAISESQKDKAVYGGRTLETIMISGHGNPLSLKIYDKVKEIEQRGGKKRWFYDRWKEQGWNIEQWKHQNREEKKRTTVKRVEFSIEREGLHEMSLEDAREALMAIPLLWAYCTRQWVRMVVPEQTRNRTRWATHPTWSLAQHAFDDYLTEDHAGLGPLVRQRKRQANIEQGTAQIAGQLTTLMAWMLNDCPDSKQALDIFNAIYQQVLELWGGKGVNPYDVIEEKQKLYHCVP